MKRLLPAVGLLIVLIALSLLHVWHITTLAHGLTQQLAQAEALAEAGQWEDAAALTQQVDETWQQSSFYLHITLRHSEIDQICASLAEVREYLQCQEEGEYSAANARLMTYLGLLAEMERPTLGNLL